ncbi:MAG: DMT family transporter [Candidatus Micrarchaeota archaeon]
MLEWVLVAISAYAFLSLVDLTSKVLRTRYIYSSTGMTALLLMGQAIPVLLIPFVDIWSLGLTHSVFALFAGALTAVPYWLFSKSLKREEVSRVSALWQTIPIFVLILAFVFLGERLPQLFYLSFVFLILGSLLISAKELSNIFKPDSVFWMMISASLIWASQLVFLKSLYTSSGFMEIFLIMCLGRLLTASVILILPSHRHLFKDLAAANKWLIVLFVLANSIGVFLYHYALAIGSVTMVEALSGFQAFFTLFSAVAISKLAPTVLHEGTEVKVLALKFAAITLMFIGLILVYL